jgi:hypothetical protein
MYSHNKVCRFRSHSPGTFFWVSLMSMQIVLLNHFFEILKDPLSRFDGKNKLVAQSYDGASVMAGELNGLQAKVKSMCPLALFTHYCAHRLNLVLQQGTNCISKCRIYFATLLGTPAFFHQSPKRTFILNNILGKRVPRAVETRWCTRSKIVHLG